MLLPLLRRSRALLTQWSSLLPCACALCGGDSRAPLCAGCDAQFFSRSRQRCLCCALPITAAGATHCGSCLRRRPAFEATLAAVDYAPPLEQLVLGLKFGNRLELAPLLAHKLGLAFDAAQLPPPTLLTAVPLGPARLRERGFNQAAEIARPLSRLLRIPLVLRLLERKRETDAQALLHPDARRKNMRRAFMVPAAAIARVQDAHVGVLDDVMTTGETLNEIAATLKRCGAARVTNFVFARTAE
jgi:ComF family protein